MSNLKSEREKVSNQINSNYEALEEIKEQNKKHIHVNIDENKADVNESRKQCKYDRKGFCRQAENCLFLHADTTCEIYLRTVVCWKLNCHKDILKRVGMDPDATEENLVDICTRTQLVVNANRSLIYYIFCTTVSFGSRVFVAAAHHSQESTFWEHL